MWGKYLLLPYVSSSIASIGHTQLCHQLRMLELVSSLRSIIVLIVIILIIIYSAYSIMQLGATIVLVHARGESSCNLLNTEIGKGSLLFEIWQHMIP